jgi:glycosyltransferase involved in cell wall biosynthesis
MAELEIVLVNDVSKDNSLQKMEELAKEDHRIKIIRNEKNMGTLYSRCIGTLLSKGKYVIPLDNDDMFLNNDVFKIVYNEIEINKVDILYFRGISVWHFNNFLNARNLHQFRSFKEKAFLSQPELGNYAIKRFVLWGQCIKTKLYQKSINLLGKERYSKYVTFFEDAIINFINNQLAEKAELFLKVGILHIDKNCSTSRIIKLVNKNLYELYFIDVIFDFSRNTINDKKTAINKTIDVIERESFKQTLNNINNKIFFKSLINKMMSSEYISNENKQIIREKIFQNKLLNDTDISLI